MRAIIQRVNSAEVLIENQKISRINTGLVVLLGISTDDNSTKIKKMCDKILNIRLFANNNKNMELSIRDINGELLIVSQFTLYANCNQGNRPSFLESADRKHAENIYNELVNYMSKQNIDVKYGKFGADMEVCLANNGPITIIYEV